MADPVDIRVMVPRVRRALEGAGAPPVLTDDAIKDLTADAIAEVILYTGGVFGHELVVTARDDATNAPTEYATDPELTLSEQSGDRHAGGAQLLLPAVLGDEGVRAHRRRGAVVGVQPVGEPARPAAQAPHQRARQGARRSSRPRARRWTPTSRSSPSATHTSARWSSRGCRARRGAGRRTSASARSGER